MLLDPRQVVRYGWVAVGVLWAILAFTTKRDVRRISPGTLLLHCAVLGLSFALVFGDYFRVGFLAARFVPRHEWIRWTGSAAAVAGFGLAIRARLELGRNWSGGVTVKEDHTLARRGPYALVRHPIYSGLSLAFLGTALVYGEARCLLGAALALFEWKRKSLIEERFLIEQFGRDYVEYRRAVKSLIPFVW